MKKDNKNRNSSLSEVEKNIQRYIRIAVKHHRGIRLTYQKGAGRSEFFNLEEGC